MNPFRRFFDFITNPSNSRTVGILALLIIGLAIPLTVNIAQRQQELRQQASGVGVCAPKCLYTKYGDTFDNCSRGGGLSCLNDPTNPEGPQASYICVEAACAPAPAPTAPTTQAPASSQPATACTATNAVSFDYACGCTDNVVGGPLPGHKATPICANNIIGSQDPTCYSDSIAGFTKCSKTGTTPPAGGAGQQSLCKINAGWNGVLVQGSCQENKQAALSLTGPGQALPTNKLSCANPTCLRGAPTKRSDDSWYCFEGDRFVGNAFCEGQSQNIGINLSPSVTCAANASATCPTSGCTAVKSANGAWYCQGQSNCAAPTCSTATAPGTAGGTATLSFTIGLDGIGTTADNANRADASGSNRDPRNKKTRTLMFKIYDTSNRVIPGWETAQVSFQDGKFKGTATGNLAEGKYLVKAYLDGSLRKSTDLIAVSNGQTTAVTLDLVNGDVNGNNRMEVLDYNILVACWPGTNTTNPATCSDPAFRTRSDLNDDGVINEFDYNLFLREFSVQQGD